MAGIAKSPVAGLENFSFSPWQASHSLRALACSSASRV